MPAASLCACTAPICTSTFGIGTSPIVRNWPAMLVTPGAAICTVTAAVRVVSTPFTRPVAVTVSGDAART